MSLSEDEAKEKYNHWAAYQFPGPLPLLPAYSAGCSKTVDAGPPLGRGKFCNYLIISAAGITTIFYNRFEREAPLA